MIPNSHLTAWAVQAPWPTSRQIEQDLIISRALCDLFSAPKLQGEIAPLLPPGVEFTDDDAMHAFGMIWNDVLPLLKGEPWKSSEKAIELLREKKFPKLLL